ncbi:DUF4160 domain-containing protein [Rhizobium puerariae]|uniref:DUF4160 domain-containing protein n=1 Tax=Rhizobium puerariae TaxID=1585791 RepID=A0ABV6ATI7_9HYPH
MKIQIFADDHHPPHFHVVTPDHEVLIGLAKLEIPAGSIDRRSLGTAMAWVTENREVLEDAWQRLNVR